MKYIIITIAIALGVGGLVFITQGNKTQSNSSELSMQTINTDISAGGQLIDVRTPAEFAESHIEGAINLPLQDIESGKLPAVTKDKQIYLYCRSGNRSNQAATILRTAGYTNMKDLGAMTSVQALGGTIKS